MRVVNGNMAGAPYFGNSEATGGVRDQGWLRWFFLPWSACLKFKGVNKESGEPEVLVRWVGYSNKFDSWEPKANVRAS